MITRPSFAPLGWVIGVVCGSGALGAGHAADQPATDPTPEAILKRTGDFYTRVPAFSMEIARDQDLGLNETHDVLSVALERPNRLAIRQGGTAA